MYSDRVSEDNESESPPPAEFCPSTLSPARRAYWPGGPEGEGLQPFTVLLRVLTEGDRQDEVPLAASVKPVRTCLV